MQNVEETNLAWALIEAAKPHLSEPECYSLFVNVGAGETFEAICVLLKLVAAKRIPLQAGLVRRCTVWLDTYARHDEEKHLRSLIEAYSIVDASPPITTAGTIQVPTAPRWTKSHGVSQFIRIAMAAG
jgi:hypothetical protein